MRRHSADDYRNVLEQSVPATLRLLGTGPPPEAAWARFGAWMFESGLLDDEARRGGAHRPTLDFGAVWIRSRASS